MYIKQLLAISLVLCLAGVASAQNWPDSIVVLGDSISRGVFADDTVTGLDAGQPEHCWSTGNSSSDSVFSHYERILANNGAISGNNYNVAESGADMDNLLAQANSAVQTGAEYVTILMGANDVCSSSVASITPADTFQSEFVAGIDVVLAGLPDAVVVVGGVPDVYHVWEVGNSNLGCLFKWALYGFCDSMLRSSSTDRAIARAANIEFNNRLSSVCASKGVIFDLDSYNVQFARGDLSNVDCFHPASSAHAMLATATYDASRF